MFTFAHHQSRSVSRFTLLVIMGLCVAVSIPFKADAQELDLPYLPTRAVVPTLADMPLLAQGAYGMGLCHDAIRWYKRIRPYNAALADFGTARCLERLGSYKTALNLLDKLYTQNTPYKDDAQKLRGHVLLILTEQAQLQGQLKQSEDYLRTFFNQHRNQRNIDRYAYLMRQQATLKNIQQGRFSPDFGQPLRVAVLLPLTGQMAEVGKSMEQAALQAMYQQNLPSLELYPEDTQGTPDGTIAAFQRTLQSGVDIILGPLLGNNVKALAPYADSADIPVMAFSSDKSALIEDGIRLLSILPTQQARRMARYGVEEKGLRTFSALVPDSHYGHVMLGAFKDELAKLGATFDRHAFFTPGEADLNAPIRYLTRMAEAEKQVSDELERLEEVYAILASAMDDDDLKRLEELRKTEAQPLVNYQALFVPASADAMPLISSQLAFYDSDGTQLQLLGSAQWDNPALTAQPQIYLHRAVYPTTPNSEQAAFSAQYTSVYGSDPHPLGMLAFDGVNLIAHLNQQGLASGGAFESRLRKLSAFHGATGPYQILDDGTMRHGYSLMQLRYRRGQLQARELSSPPYLLPPETPPLGEIRNVSNRSLTRESLRPDRGFFGGLFGN